MAHFLTTKGIAAELERILRSSREFIGIVTYSLKIDELYIDRLKAASRRGVKIQMVFGVGENKVIMLNELLNIPNIEIHVKDNVHAKLYMNESSMLLTSMNLYNYSEANNVEYGMLIHKKDHPLSYEDALFEVKELIGNSRRIESEISKRQEKYRREDSGYCIRCGYGIFYDPLKPLCPDCYNTWAFYCNRDYMEDFCHECGDNPAVTDVSYAKPRCFPCFVGKR